MWFQCLLLARVFHAVSGASSPKYVWPVCSKSYNFEVEAGGQTILPIDAKDYQFVGPHSSIPCDPIDFDGSTYTHMDLSVSNDNQFEKLSFCVHIKAMSDTGTVLQYKSDNGNQNIIIFVEGGKAVVSYTHNSFSMILKTDAAALVVNQWYLISFVQYDKGVNAEILLTNQASQWKKAYGSSVPSPLVIPGKIRIGSTFDGSGTNFQGQMICVAMYDSEFSHVDFADNLDSCQNVQFPASSQLPSTPPPPKPVYCDPTIHKRRNDTHFIRLENSAFIAAVNHLEQKYNTTLRECATYCVLSETCVSFTVTNVPDELKICRLFEVFDIAEVVVETESSLYVLNVCRFL